MTTQLPQKLESAKLYASLMNEIKVRISAIDAGTSGQLHMVPSPIVQEFCYLQLRMCCELVALGCLVAHGDITPDGMKKVWEADKIIAQLEALHPHFFPQPVKQTRLPTHHHLEGVKDGFLTKAELLKLYRRCGDRLHRGSLKKLMAQGKIPMQVNYPEITKIAQSIHDLLSVHIVMMLGGHDVFVCVLRVNDKGGEVQVAIANASAPPEFKV